ncbi:MAG: UDP-glucose 4-epimerase GalE, partial [Planctomycetota bacterium]
NSPGRRRTTMNVLVTGGAGYIGSHAVQRLAADGHRVVAMDNLYRGHRAAVPAEVAFVEADLLDYDKTVAALREHEIDCVMNFAALAYVGESVDEPLSYYHNNTAGVLTLLRAMDAAGVHKMVHSSTCATYGEPPEDRIPIREDCPQQPINPYGMSKLMVEHILKDYAHANPDFAFAAPRYFNVAGSDPQARIGEDHHPETHLIPVLLNTALGKRGKAYIFGDDYPTPDGTGVRDYVHVVDLVDAHVVLMNALEPGDQRFYNLGIGNGLSVRQIIDAVKKVTGVDFTVEVADRRPGDPPTLYADPRKMKDELGWEAKITDVETMVADAWRWFQANPDGYGDASKSTK